MKLKYRYPLLPIVYFYLNIKPKSLGDSSFAKALEHKKGLPPRLASPIVDPATDNLPPLFQHFYHIYQETFIVPLDDHVGNLHGFLLRSVKDKAFRVLSESKALFYGWQDFENYTPDQPIILTEGVKDAEAFKVGGYPYTLAMLSSRLSTSQYHIVSRLSHCIYVVLDSDLFGIRHSRWMERKWGFKRYQAPEKDVGTIWESNSVLTRNFIKAVVIACKQHPLIKNPSMNHNAPFI